MMTMMMMMSCTMSLTVRHLSDSIAPKWLETCFFYYLLLTFFIQAGELIQDEQKRDNCTSDLFLIYVKSCLFS